jgi:hypothetical protein
MDVIVRKFVKSMDVIVRMFVWVYHCYRSEICLGLCMLLFGSLFTSIIVIVRKFV